MIKSMTGYGCGKGESCGFSVTAEVRSVNNRYLDCNIRIPRIYTAVEDALKSVVSKHITRGKVDVYITLTANGGSNLTVTVNEKVADSYVQAVRSLADRFGLNNDISAMSLARLQDVLSVESTQTDTDALGKDLCVILDAAMQDFDSMRFAEGRRLFDDISARLDEIEHLTAQAEKRSPETVVQYRERLYAKMQEVLENKDIDENRILLEAAIFADRVAVNEEIVRLRSHVSQLRTMLQSDEPVGRKIDFLIQELNREANTLGSKGNDGEMARIVIDLKAEIEKIREQIQNVE